MNDRQLKVLVALASLFALMFFIILYKISRAPNIPILISEKDAKWIKYPNQFQISALAPTETYSAFRTKIVVTSKPISAILTIRAYKLSAVFWDGEKILSPKNSEHWKQKIQLDLKDHLTPGEHELMLLVSNKDARPTLLAHCDALSLRTDESWESSADGANWVNAVAVDHINVPSIYLMFPSSNKALLSTSHWLIPSFVFLFPLFFVLSKNEGKIRLPFNMGGAEATRWLAIALVLLLGINHAFRLPLGVGYDVRGHLEYIQIIAHGRLPKPEEGWSTFQSPLYHIISAPFYIIFSWFLSEDETAKALRFIPVICGLLRVELIYRTTKVVLPENTSAQVLAIIIGAFMPMNIYHMAVLNNESLSGVLSALAVLIAIKVFLHPARNIIWLGVAIGLAVLTKMSGFLLLPIATLAVVAGFAREDKWLKHAGISLVVICALVLVVAGWYYIRNLAWVSEANLGYWNPGSHTRYWQDPSYRTPTQFLSFGACLSRPIYSAVFGVWDALYSTMWCDGYLSGIIRHDHRPPWNYNSLISLALLSLPIAIAIILSTMLALLTPQRTTKNGLFITALSILVYLGGFLLNYLAVPIYSAGKSSYLLGVLPSLAITGGMGFSKLMKNSVGKALVFSYIVSWAFVSFSAFFVI